MSGLSFEAPRNAFFTISFPQYSSKTDPSADKNLIDPSNIKSMSITEELGKSVQGSIEIDDPEQMYARVLRVNAQMLVSWGYKANGAPIEDMFGAGNADVFGKTLERRGLKVLVLNPSGKGNADGTCDFSCGMLSMGWFGSPQFKTYDSGTKIDCVKAAMSRMGIKAGNQYVQFDAMSSSYSSESVERQSETDFQFLSRLSTEWRCVFQIGFRPDGDTYAAFYSFANSDHAWYNISRMTGSPVSSPSISWKYFDPGDLRVISYDWRNEEGENGEGDNVQMVLVNGQPTFQRFTMENEKVTTWTLDADAVSEYVAKGNDISPVMSAESFNDPNIKKFWRASETTTAPNGLGYTINLHMLGNPAVTVGMVFTFNRGFPPNLRLKDGAPIRFIVRRATHTISQSGYFTDLEVVDLLTISAVGVR